MLTCYCRLSCFCNYSYIYNYDVNPTNSSESMAIISFTGALSCGGVDEWSYPWRDKRQMVRCATKSSTTRIWTSYSLHPISTNGREKSDDWQRDWWSLNGISSVRLSLVLAHLENSWWSLNWAEITASIIDSSSLYWTMWYRPMFAMHDREPYLQRSFIGVSFSKLLQMSIR